MDQNGSLDTNEIRAMLQKPKVKEILADRSLDFSPQKAMTGNRYSAKYWGLELIAIISLRSLRCPK